MDSIWSTPNVAAAIVALFGAPLAAVVTILVTEWRRNRGDKKTVSKTYSDREIEARTRFIELQAARITELEKQLDEARNWNNIIKPYRHLVAGVVTYAFFLKQRLEKNGETIAPFVGFKRFEEEGGHVRPEWVDTIGGGWDAGAKDRDC